MNWDRTVSCKYFFSGVKTWIAIGWDTKNALILVQDEQKCWMRKRAHIRKLTQPQYGEENGYGRRRGVNAGCQVRSKRCSMETLRSERFLCNGRFCFRSKAYAIRGREGFVRFEFFEKRGMSAACSPPAPVRRSNVGRSPCFLFSLAQSVRLQSLLRALICRGIVRWYEVHIEDVLRVVSV